MRYLGERARIAVACLNASYVGEPITADGDGWWKVPRAPTAWDFAISASSYLRWSDEAVIAQAASDPWLIIPPNLTDNREVRP